MACPPAWRILYHVIASCKRPIICFLARGESQGTLVEGQQIELNPLGVEYWNEYCQDSEYTNLTLGQM